MSAVPLLPLAAITQRIVVLREQKVLIDADLAALYGDDHPDRTLVGSESEEDERRS